MRNDVSCCAMFSCLGPSVQGVDVLWEAHGRGWNVVVPAAAASVCPRGFVLPHLNVPSHLVHDPFMGGGHCVWRSILIFSTFFQEGVRAVTT